MERVPVDTFCRLFCFSVGGTRFISSLVHQDSMCLSFDSGVMRHITRVSVLRLILRF